ncbi:MAG TPA: winged helix-turn-helix transcriptional regulator [Thermoanaerobaculia bacterium]|nr:winged helix-turn-helix transcriptional regulator [Thermoanaerobaculia bacterium]
MTKLDDGRIFKGSAVVWETANREELTIITVDQLPESRRAILLTLKREGPATIARLADELQLTGEAVRQQLLQLQREGWIEAKIAREAERGRTGRPATRYSLTEAGDHLFPKNYDVLNVAVLDAIEHELGPEAALRVLRRVTDERVAAGEGQVRGRPLEERVQALKSLYLEGDPYMAVEPAPDGFYLVERNCPFYNTAMRRPVLCNVSVNALTRLLGVRVEREERFQNGDGRCVFHVHANEPVEGAEFRVEA